MFWILFACTVGSSGPASPSSSSATEAETVGTIAEKSGALSNKARELEAASQAARQRIENGATPSTETEKIRVIRDQIEKLEGEIQAEHDALLDRIKATQSTDETRE